MARRTFQLNDHVGITLAEQIQIALPISGVFHVSKFELHSQSHACLHMNSVAELEHPHMFLVRFAGKLPKFGVIGCKALNLGRNLYAFRIDRVGREIGVATRAMLIVKLGEVEISALMLTVAARTAFQIL
mgnify:CR=1 FL=1